MSFLDNQPRSASVEALQPCDVVEIPRGKFDEFLNAQPSWMKSLVQTLVKRLRATSNRVRELESSSTVYAKDEDGRTTKLHEFLSTPDTLKLASAVLLASCRNSEKLPDGSAKVKAGWVQYYGSQIFGVQLSKIQVFIDVLQEGGILTIERSGDQIDLRLNDIDRLEKFIYFAQDEHGKVDEKRMPITEKGVAIIAAVNQYSGISSTPASTETLAVNMEDVLQKAAAASGNKIPFDLASFEELVKSGFAQEIRVSGAEKTALFQVSRFQKLAPLLELRQRFHSLNAQKRA
jgi:hypothetical protein